MTFLHKHFIVITNFLNNQKTMLIITSSSNILCIRIKGFEIILIINDLEAILVIWMNENVWNLHYNKLNLILSDLENILIMEFLEPILVKKLYKVQDNEANES